MPFKTLLASLVEAVPQSTGAILVDWEGEAVEQHTLGDPYHIKVTAAHWGIILERLKNLRKEHPTGQLQHALITTSDQQAMIGPVGDDYTLVLTMTREALAYVAKERFQETAGLLRKEIY